LNRLEGKVVFVTGGGNGIGAESARRFVAEGAQVVVADIKEDDARSVADDIGKGAAAIYYDGGDEASVRAGINDAAARFGRLDVLHNNHALLSGGENRDNDVINTELVVWEKSIAVSLTGYFLGCKYAIPHMINAGGGSIINMTSDSALSSDFTHVAYGAAKAGVISLTRSIAMNHGRQGVRCNAIAPGLIVTSNVRKWAPHLVEIVGRHIMVKEHGEPRDIAALAAFLAADESRFITGQTISCDGGLIARLPQTADMIDYADHLRPMKSDKFSRPSQGPELGLQQQEARSP
jgi:NAD(P)-dependent dehydrogenase (short-subunit alcohol dehydrogenase family)